MGSKLRRVAGICRRERSRSSWASPSRGRLGRLPRGIERHGERGRDRLEERHRVVARLVQVDRDDHRARACRSARSSCSSTGTTSGTARTTTPSRAARPLPRSESRATESDWAGRVNGERTAGALGDFASAARRRYDHDRDDRQQPRSSPPSDGRGEITAGNPSPTLDRSSSPAVKRLPRTRRVLSRMRIHRWVVAGFGRAPELASRTNGCSVMVRDAYVHHLRGEWPDAVERLRDAIGRGLQSRAARAGARAARGRPGRRGSPRILPRRTSHRPVGRCLHPRRPSLNRMLSACWCAVLVAAMPRVFRKEVVAGIGKHDGTSDR